MNITKTENGFIVDGLSTTYLFKNNEYEILSEDQCHIFTNSGIIFFDTSVTIEEESFTTIESWIIELYKDTEQTQTTENI